MKTIIALALAFSATTAFAQTKAKRSSATVAPAATVSTTVKSETTTTDWKANHISVGLLIGTSSEIKGADSSENGKKVASADISSSNAMGLAAQYEDAWVGPWKWTVGATLFRNQDMDNAKRTVNGQSQSLKMKASYQPLVVSVGAKYLVNDQIYFPVGLNTTLINNTNKGDMDSLTMSPQIGYQFGVGAKLNRNIMAELNYVRIAYNMESKINDQAKIGGDVRMEGLALQGRYLF